MKTLLRKHIHSRFASFTSDDVFMEISCDLPFVPSIGMSLCTSGLEITVIEVSYNLDTETLHVWDEADKELYDADVKDKMHGRVNKKRLFEIVEEYLSQGWRVRADDIDDYVALREAVKDLPISKEAGKSGS